MTKYYVVALYTDGCLTLHNNAEKMTQKKAEAILNSPAYQLDDIQRCGAWECDSFDKELEDVRSQIRSINHLKNRLGNKRFIS